jgi:uncharacterized protein
MGMQIEKSFTVNAPAAKVWEFLTDPYAVARCLPGAAITGKNDDGSYGGTITVKVGPVTASYRGKMRFERLDADAGEAEIVASGQETRGKGGADMRMTSRVTESAPGVTEVKVVSDVNVVGVLAQFGRGMIQDVGDLLFQKFTEALRRELETPAGAAAAPAGPAGTTGDAATAVDGTGVAAEPAPPAGVPSPAAPEPPRPPAAQPPAAQVLDVGALGAAAAGRAAGRTLRSPGFWIAVAVVALLAGWFFFG